MSITCFLEPDLSTVRLVGDGFDETWRPPTDAQPESAAVARTLRRARDAAAWTANRLGKTHRLGIVCIGIEDSICSRIAAPSSQREVVVAALAHRQREWTSDIGGAGVHPLARPVRRALLGVRRASPRQDGHGAPDDPARPRPNERLTVIEQHDGPVRLWLDEMDRRRLAPSSVMTFWHALAAAWTLETGASRSDGASAAPASLPGARMAHDVTAVVCESAGRLLWCWTRSGELLVGGSSRAPRIPGDAPDPLSAEPPGAIPPSPREVVIPPRLTLDWLAWSAFLGVSPERIMLISPDPAPLTSAFRAAWKGASIDTHQGDDPLARTLALTTHAPAPPADDPRQSILELTHRPGRDRRLLAVWSAAFIVLLAGAITAGGVRERMTIARTRLLTDELRADTLTKVAAIDPALARDPDPVRALRSVLTQERESRKPIAIPVAERPIHAELAHLGDVISAVITDPAVANVRQIKLDENIGEVSIFIPDYATGESILQRLRETPGSMRWRGSFSGIPPVTQRLQAIWEGEGL